MIGLDTNILVRHIVADDEEQAALAGELIEHHCTQEAPAHIALVVLCELAWVLKSGYGYPRDEVARALRQVLMTDCFEIENHALAWNALYDYENSSADYADSIIARINREQDCSTTFTFDRRAARYPDFTLLEP